MKFSVGILSLFFLVFSLLPCLDLIPVSEAMQDEVSLTQCDDSQGEAPCSVLCDCQCCVFHFIDYHPFHFSTDHSETTVGSFAYFDQKDQDVLISFLQPPRN